MKQGSRDLYANLIKVSTPDNFYACNLAFATGIGQFHGMRLRDLTGGQLPVVVYKSINRGKSQGKSGVARMVCYLTSDWKSNKLSPKLSTETIKKKCSFTTTPIYFDDVKMDSFIGRITESFDDGATYETAEGVYPQRSEVFFTANYFGMDEEATSDSERTCDRLAVIPFQEWGFMPAAEFTHRQSQFKAVVDCQAKPTELVIGELGDFINSAEFLQKRSDFGDWMYNKAEVVKIRTLLNYGSFVAIHWKLHQIFKTVWDDMGYTWEGFIEWVETVFIPFLVSQHMEKDHAIHSLRRYVNGLLDFASGMSETEVQKFMRICSTRKTKEKHVLAIHPDKRYPDLKQLGLVKLVDVKKHLPSVGGLWDDSTYATLVRTEVDDLDTTSEDRSNMVAKRALFIPFSVFTSSQKMKICDVTGQKEYYSLADSETPSGAEDPKNSTAATSGIQLRLALSDVSRINIPNEDTMNEVSLHDQIFGNQDAHTEDHVNGDEIEEERDGDTEDDFDQNDEEQDENIDVQEYPCGLCGVKLSSLETLISHMQEHQKQISSKKGKGRSRQIFPCELCELFFKSTRELKDHIKDDHDENLSAVSVSLSVSCTDNDTVQENYEVNGNKSKSSNISNPGTSNPLNEKDIQVSNPGSSKPFKPNSSRDITLVNESFVCTCGFSSSSKSGASRHKCHKDKLLITCKFCDKHCGNPGSLKLHTRSKHKKELEESLAATQELIETMVTLDEESTVEQTQNHEVVTEETSNAGKKCAHCEKLCANSGSLKLHMKAKHKVELEKTALEGTALEKEDTNEVVVDRSRNGGVKCLYCEKSCGNSGSLKIHMRYKHKEELEKSASQTHEVRNDLAEEEGIVHKDADGISTTNVIRKSARRRSISSHKSKSSASRNKK